MSNKISRRDFLKLAGVGVATTAVLTGYDPARALCSTRAIYENAGVRL